MKWFNNRNASVKQARCLIAFSLIFFSCLSAARAADFPGRGDRLLWGYALQNYDQANRYMNQQRYQEAIDQYKQAIARYEYDPDFYVNLGVAYTKIGDNESAERTLITASQLNKADWMPWSNLANIYAKQNKLKEALPIFERALKCNPPAAEIEPIKNNIAGIKRILNAQARFESASKPAATSKVSVKATSKVSPKANAGQKTANAGAKISHKVAGQENATQPTGAPDRDSLKKSGWDWSY